jgi:hypothetical protein
VYTTHDPALMASCRKRLLQKSWSPEATFLVEAVGDGDGRADMGKLSDVSLACGLDAGRCT